MTQDEIIEMAESCGWDKGNTWDDCMRCSPFNIEAFAKLVAQHERSWEKFCDSNCVWTDHHPDCKLAKDEPVAWVGLNLDNMAEAFHRVIEEHHSRKNPFHDPVNGDAMIALRELRGLIAYMKRNTTPPQRTWVGLTYEDMVALQKDLYNAKGESVLPTTFAMAVEAKLKEKNT
jgi:hypothetical protein